MPYRTSSKPCTSQWRQWLCRGTLIPFNILSWSNRLVVLWGAINFIVFQGGSAFERCAKLMSKGRVHKLTPINAIDFSKNFRPAYHSPWNHFFPSYDLHQYRFLLFFYRHGKCFPFLCRSANVLCVAANVQESPKSLGQRPHGIRLVIGNLGCRAYHHMLRKVPLVS